MKTVFIVLLFLLGLADTGYATSSKKSKTPAKALRSKQSKRMPSSSESMRVYSEHTSFEELLENRERHARRPAAFSVKARVIGIRRDIGLSNESDNNSQRDVVLNAGANAGLSKGMVLGVKRKIPILDPYRENVQRLLEIEFARVKVVHVQDELAIARITEVDNIEDGLAVGLRSVVIGDYVGTN